MLLCYEESFFAKNLIAWGEFERMQDISGTENQVGYDKKLLLYIDDS